MTPSQAYKPAHGGYPQVAGFPYASLGAAKAQAQRDAEARRRVADILWDEPTFLKTGMIATPDAKYRIVASADNAH